MTLKTCLSAESKLMKKTNSLRMFNKLRKTVKKYLNRIWRICKEMKILMVREILKLISSEIKALKMPKIKEILKTSNLEMIKTIQTVINSAITMLKKWILNKISLMSNLTWAKEIRNSKTSLRTSVTPPSTLRKRNQSTNSASHTKTNLNSTKKTYPIKTKRNNSSRTAKRPPKTTREDDFSSINDFLSKF